MKKYLVILTAFAAVAMGGCKKYLDVNVNPNTATQTKANFVFTNALARTVANQVGGVHTMAGSWVGWYGHSTSFTGGGQEKTYVFTNNDFNYFDGMYDNIADYTHVIAHAEADGVAHLAGPAKVMRAYVFQKLVDLYGNVPYTQAMQLVSDPQSAPSLTPVYDDDQAIYEDLIVQLTNAIAEIKAASFPTTDLADIQFKGNKANWIKFANTVKMRILMRQSNMPGRDTYIVPKINEIIAEGSGLITDNVLVQPGYLKSSGKLNPFYANYGYDQNDAQSGGYPYRRMGAVLINFLKTTNDIFRLSRIAAPNGYDPDDPRYINPLNPNYVNPALTSSYTGIPLGGSGAPYQTANVAAIGSMMVKRGDAQRPALLMTVAEAYFLKAEAIQRYGSALGGTAQSNYEDGVRWSFRNAAGLYAGASAATADDATATAAANAYMAGGGDNVNWTASTNKLRAIWIQKYIALVHVDGLEAWSEYRRTNTLPTSTGSAPTNPQSVATTSAQPVRLFYPLREQNVNSANYVSVNVFTDRIFWDVN